MLAYFLYPEIGKQQINLLKTTISQPVKSTTGASSPTVSPTASAAYEKLIAYKTGDYGQQSIADFNAMLALTPDELTELLAAVADVGNTISHDDENYDFFTTTIPFSSQELYCEHMREELTFLCHSLNKADRATIWTRTGKQYMVFPVSLMRMSLILSMPRNL